MSEPATPDGLERSLGLFDITCVVMSAIIGVGIFFQPARVARLTGSPGLSLAAWLIGGAIALAGALTFAELGGLFPRTGGQYVVLKESFGRAVAFLYCWALLTVIQSGAVGIIGIIFVQNLARAAGLALAAGAEAPLAALLVVVLALVNVLGLRQGARVTNATMVLKAVTLVGIALLGLVVAVSGGGTSLARGAMLAPAVPAGGLRGLVAALIPVLFTFAGWQQATYVGGEVRDPGRNMPRGILAGVAGVFVLYLSANAGYLALLGLDRMAASRTLAADAVGAVFPGAGARLTALAVAVSALGITNVCMMSAPRMYKAMADDGAFFAAIGRVHATFRTPANAIAAQAAIAVLLVLVAGMRGVDYLTTGVVCLDWVFFALTGAALFVLRRKRPGDPRPYRAWGYPLVPGLFVLAALGAIAASFADPATRSASVVAVLVLLTGGAAFAAFSRSCRGAAAPPR